MRSCRDTSLFLCGNYLDLIDPRWPSVPLSDPTEPGKRKFTRAVWIDGLYREPRTSVGAILHMDAELFLTTFRRIYGRTPTVDDNGECIVSESEMLEMASALWPEVRRNNVFYTRRCKSAKALKALRLPK